VIINWVSWPTVMLFYHFSGGSMDFYGKPWDMTSCSVTAQGHSCYCQICQKCHKFPSTKKLAKVAVRPHFASKIFLGPPEKDNPLGNGFPVDRPILFRRTQKKRLPSPLWRIQFARSFHVWVSASSSLVTLRTVGAKYSIRHWNLH